VASEFRPHHPVSFWIAILLLIYAFTSGALAMSQIDDCQAQGTTHQHWSFWPPGWVCDG
jgi:hypothetical protein